MSERSPDVPYTLANETVLSLTFIRNTMRDLAGRLPQPHPILWLLPSEWAFFARRGWVKLVPDPRTVVTTTDCPACPPGIEVRRRCLEIPQSKPVERGSRAGAPTHRGPGRAARLPG
jgi:hypothetical protein